MPCPVLPSSLLQWFFDSVTAGVCLPEDGYLVTPPPPPSEPGSAVAYSQPWAVELNKFEPSVDLSDTVLEGCKVGGVSSRGVRCTYVCMYVHVVCDTVHVWNCCTCVYVRTYLWDAQMMTRAGERMHTVCGLCVELHCRPPLAVCLVYTWDVMGSPFMYVLLCKCMQTIVKTC